MTRKPELDAAAPDLMSAEIAANRAARRSPDDWLELIDTQATALAETLRDASDANVPHALILPRLMLVFRTSFGEPPAGFTLPGMT